MTINATTITTTLVVILFVPYLISIIRKVQNHQIPFLKALHPFYTKEMNEAALLKERLSPIVREMETQTIAKFVKHWTSKFEATGLSEQDVLELNAKIEGGEQDQVYGILALHPQGRIQFDQINAQLKEKYLQETEVMA
ncbi:hypothetical protein DBR11_24130 [Pedobacter sp. HMWF019]|uniref:hypothetical protein n=1 Tax=Pedobacter sp. HMWF019 TaxID=2056856 RepID=UPI000D3CD09F|nr:hypothetical protein [Pedobacter sp. HMWF019]PTS94119.1 hypothetical protein DBR11_24130 [Pedobacter sp. HMWF019]